jgi:hypothetical protein|tara:strand:- start:16226 stop:17464 length:1239 start_codon:yes stop_codon:yes gene_type:complete
MRVPVKQHKGYDPLGACGKGKCPVCARNNALFNLKPSLEREEFTSESYSVFVGRYNYPNVNVGILEPPQQSEDSWLYDAPIYWAEHDFQIPKIVELRSSLINSRFKSNILDARKNTKFLDIGKEVAMSSKPVDIEVNLHKKPRFKLNIDSHTLPMGPSAQLKQIKLTENPKIHPKIEKVVSDTDLKASDALKILYKSKFDENSLTKLLSIGNLGLKKNRKLVPTRFSITAVDSNIGNNLVNEIKQHQESGYLAYFGGYLGNYFLILFFPEVYSYELFETYVPTFNRKKQFTSDFEPYGGRKSYAESTAGGFYASRLAALEKLKGIRKQASVLVLRFITDEYTIPLGVFVVRESVRKTLSNKPLEFGSKELMLKYAKLLIRKKFNIDVYDLLKHSKVLKNIIHQRKLTKFSAH